MLLTFDKFGGRMPRVNDPLLIPDENSQVATNCRFDRRGVMPLAKDSEITTAPIGTKSIYRYKNAGNVYYFTWDSLVSVCGVPLFGDKWNRVFYLEDGELRVTDSTLFKYGGSTGPYPVAYRNPSPPAPSSSLTTAKAPAPPDPVNLLTDPTVIPYMTVSADGVSRQPPLNACDGNTATYWRSSNTLLNPVMHWWKVDFGEGHEQAVNYIEITFDPTISSIARGPVSFTIEASTTGTFSGEQVKIYSTSNQMWTTGSLETKTFSFINYTKYRSFRIYVTKASNAVLGHHDVYVNEFVLMAKPATPDETYEETRAYVYTFVNSYGQEGPPTTPNVEQLINVFDGDSVDLSGFDTSQPVDANGIQSYDIVGKRLYRLNTNSSGDSQYQLVEDETILKLDTATYTDSKPNSALGEVLMSSEWDGPPIGVKGLISLPNSVLACYIDNILCLSASKYPHAWPASNQYFVDRPIIGLGSFGTSVVILTDGVPYIAIGNDPGNMAMEKLDMGFACTSARGIVQAGEVVVYPSTEGLIAIGSGIREVISDKAIDGTTWRKLYQPSTIIGFYWEGKYVGFYGTGVGFMFDLKTRDFVDLDFYSSAGYYEPSTGNLYLVSGLKIITLATADSTETIA